MLVLSRKVGQTIAIGEGITITVTRIGREKAWLGITAPADIRIVRDDAIKKTREEEDNGNS